MASNYECLSVLRTVLETADVGQQSRFDELQGKLTAQMELLQSSLENMQVRLGATEEQAEVLKARLGASEAQSEELKVRLCASEEQSDGLKARLGVSEAQSEELKARLTASAEQVDSFRARLEASEGQVSALKDQSVVLTRAMQAHGTQVMAQALEGEHRLGDAGIPIGESFYVDEGKYLFIGSFYGRNVRATFKLTGCANERCGYFVWNKSTEAISFHATKVFHASAGMLSVSLNEAQPWPDATCGAIAYELYRL